MKRFYYYSDRQLDGLRWMARVMEFGVSLSCTVAINELFTAHMSLREDRLLYRREVKMAANNAIKKAEIKKGNIMSAMKDEVFYDAYSDLAIDLSEDLMSMLRFNIKQELDKARHPKAATMADVETARVMLFLAKQQYDSVLQEAKDRWDLPDRMLQNWQEFNMKDILDFWEKTCDMIYRGKSVNLNTPNILSVVEKIGRAFGDGEYIEICLQAARQARPNFFNDIVCIER